MGGQCKECGCTEIETDDARGASFCTGCGSVLESDIIISEVSFEEGAQGTQSVVGQFISADRTGPRTSSDWRHGNTRGSRAVTVDNGRRRLENLASQLRMTSHHVDMATNIYQMALRKRWCCGRKINLTTAACLYMVCRLENTPHMLLDLSDIIRVNVYTIGQAYLSLSKCLALKVPNIDPALYIPRFAQDLQFGDRTKEVSDTALRLLQRMKSDWIAIGRRPSGLCGAALLASAKIHDFHRTVREVVDTVKISETAIRKRLVEFGSTASGDLTIEDFFHVDIEQEGNPPCLGRHRDAVVEAEDNEQFIRTINEVSLKIDEELANWRPRSGHGETSGATVSGVRYSESINTLEVLDSSNLDSQANSFLIDSAIEGLIDVSEEDDDRELDSVTKDSVLEIVKNISTSFDEEEVDEYPHEASDELDLDGIDDDEIDTLILSKEEHQVKSQLWYTDNADWLIKERQRLEAKRLEEKEKTSEKRPIKKQPAAGSGKRHKTSSSWNGVIRKASKLTQPTSVVVNPPKQSSKLNYDILLGLQNNNNKEVSDSKDPQTIVIN